MSETKPSAGAMRAAASIVDGLAVFAGVNNTRTRAANQRRIASIIDRETGVVALLEAARAVRDNRDPIGFGLAHKALRAAIADAERGE